MPSGFYNGEIMFADNVRFDGDNQPGQVTSDGQLLIGSSITPNIRVGNLASSDGSIVFTNGNGTIDLSVYGAILWSAVTTNQNMTVNSGYIAISAGGALTFALPTISSVGDILEITLDGATSFQITQAVNQSIRFGSTTTTVGITGSITSTAQGDTLRLVCSVANLKWNVLSSIGTLTIA